MAEDEHNRLLSTSHAIEDDETGDADVKRISYIHSKSASADVASSIKDVHINENPQSKPTSLFRRSLSASKSHRRVVSQDSDSDEDVIGPPIPSTNSSQPQLSTYAGDNSDDDEIGPPAPAAQTLPNVRQGDAREGSDEEIGPSLPDTAASESKEEDKGFAEEQTEQTSDDDDDDSDDGSEVVDVSVFRCSCTEIFIFFGPHCSTQYCVDAVYCGRWSVCLS